MASGNPIAHLQAQLRAFEGGFRSWLAAQPAAVEVPVVTVATALQGAAIGGLMCKFNAYKIIQTLPIGTAFSRQVQAFAGLPLVVQACNFAVMAGTYAGTKCIMKRGRGADDIINSMVAAVGSGIVPLFSDIEDVPGKVVSAITLGCVLTLFIHELRPLEDAEYSKVKRMLTSLGLQGYGNDFRNAGLTNEILPLITESTLHAIKIPPRYAVQIVAHIQRDSECVGKRKR